MSTWWVLPSVAEESITNFHLNTTIFLSIFSRANSIIPTRVLYYVNLFTCHYLTRVLNQYNQGVEHGRKKKRILNIMRIEIFFFLFYFLTRTMKITSLLMLFIVVGCRGNSKFYVNVTGDITLGALFPVHRKGSNGANCGKIQVNIENKIALFKQSIFLFFCNFDEIKEEKKNLIIQMTFEFSL